MNLTKIHPPTTPARLIITLLALSLAWSSFSANLPSVIFSTEQLVGIPLTNTLVEIKPLGILTWSNRVMALVPWTNRTDHLGNFTNNMIPGSYRISIFDRRVDTPYTNTIPDDAGPLFSSDYITVGTNTVAGMAYNQITANNLFAKRTNAIRIQTNGVSAAAGFTNINFTTGVTGYLSGATLNLGVSASGGGSTTNSGGFGQVNTNHLSTNANILEVQLSLLTNTGRSLSTNYAVKYMGPGSAYLSVTPDFGGQLGFSSDAVIRYSLSGVWQTAYSWPEIQYLNGGWSVDNTKAQMSSAGNFSAQNILNVGNINSTGMVTAVAINGGHSLYATNTDNALVLQNLSSQFYNATEFRLPGVSTGPGAIGVGGTNSGIRYNYWHSNPTNGADTLWHPLFIGVEGKYRGVGYGSFPRLGVNTNGDVGVMWFPTGTSAGLNDDNLWYRTNGWVFLVSTNNPVNTLAVTNGNVGIGIGAPAYPLDVEGSANINGTLIVDAITLDGSDVATQLAGKVDESSGFATNITLAGPVTFTNQVTLNTDNLTTGIVVNAQSLALTNANARATIGGVGGIARLEITNAVGSTLVPIFHAGTNNTDGFFVGTNGNIGTGTNAPANTAHFIGSGFTGVVLGRRSDSAATSITLHFDSSTAGYTMQNASGVLRFINGGSAAQPGSGAETMRLTSAGLLGVGLTPLRAIQAQGDIYATNGVVAFYSSTTGPAWVTNGIGALWTSNGAIYARASRVGGTNWADTLILAAP